MNYLLTTTLVPQNFVVVAVVAVVVVAIITMSPYSFAMVVIRLFPIA